jgi:hypothetical protein
MGGKGLPNLLTVIAVYQAGARMDRRNEKPRQKTGFSVFVQLLKSHSLRAPFGDSLPHLTP